MHIGRFLMVDLPGPELDAKTRAHLEQLRPGGVILFRKNIASRGQAQALIKNLRQLLGPELLIAIDQEGGGVFRTTDLPFAPSAMSLGAANEPELAKSVGETVARGLRQLGVNWDFAPVLDVNNNPGNPVISDRSFGEDPEAVARLALAWAEGLMHGGVAACAKHFPGHGDTNVDSHYGLPRVEKTRSELERLEFLPFHKAVAAKIPAIMTAHIIYPALEGVPATLSRKILTDLLRKAWGYEGVIVTDSMGMKAIADFWGRGEAALKSLNAGADLIEALGSFEEQLETLHFLEHAKKSGTLEHSHLEAADARLSALAKRFPINPIPYDSEQELVDRAFLAFVWGRGITTFGKPNPPSPGARILLVAAHGVAGENVTEAGISGPELTKELADVYEVESAFFSLGNSETDSQERRRTIAAAQAARANGRKIIFASTSRHRLPEAIREMAKQIQPDLHLALWNPYSSMDVPAPALITYGYRPEAMVALLLLLHGRTSATAIAPITLKG